MTKTLLFVLCTYCVLIIIVLSLLLADLIIFRHINYKPMRYTFKLVMYIAGILISLAVLITLLCQP